MLTAEQIAEKRASPRPGMWVVHKDFGVGIIHTLKDGVAEFHRVSPDTGATLPFVHPKSGEILQGWPVPTTDLRQAAWGEIPECRRPDQMVARFFGYL